MTYYTTPTAASTTVSMTYTTPTTASTSVVNDILMNHHQQQHQEQQTSKMFYRTTDHSGINSCHQIQTTAPPTPAAASTTATINILHNQQRHQQRRPATHSMTTTIRSLASPRQVSTRWELIRPLSLQDQKQNCVVISWLLKVSATGKVCPTDGSTQTI